MLKILSAVLLIASLTACSAIRDPRDAPWDPPAGRALHEQLPNWRNEGMIRCGGHLKPENRRPGQSDRC